MFQGHKPYMKTTFFRCSLTPVTAKLMKVCSEWLWLMFVTFFDSLDPKMDHFGDPQTSPFSAQNSLRGPGLERKVHQTRRKLVQSLPD